MKPELGLSSQPPRTRDQLDLAPRFTEHDAVRRHGAVGGGSDLRACLDGVGAAVGQAVGLAVSELTDAQKKEISTTFGID